MRNTITFAAIVATLALTTVQGASVVVGSRTGTKLHKRQYGGSDNSGFRDWLGNAAEGGSPSGANPDDGTSAGGWQGGAEGWEGGSGGGGGGWQGGASGGGGFEDNPAQGA
ncbi:hypothetical protein MBANPS3_007421, partial [Mucor bainieri]